MPIQPGLNAELTHLVTEKDSAKTYGSGLVPVLSTPLLIALMESAAQSSVAAHLEPGTTTVGVAVDMRHLAATPIGMQVRVYAELVEVDGRRLSFRVDAWDQVEKIGECKHERFIIDTAHFMKRVSGKLQAL
mgnify:CR=1 FL=1